MRFLLFLTSFLANSLMAHGWPPDSDPCRSDLDGNGAVGVSDLVLMLADFGADCDADPPEPLVWPVIAFSELHYNPGAQQGSDSNYEFLELMNTDSLPVNLAGWSIGEGLDYTFPEDSWIAPGEFAVVTTAPLTYAGLGYPVFDWGSGGLNNSGELLALRAPDGTVVEYVEYSDSGDWDSAPDGQGPSLERLFMDEPATEASTWSASINVGGTPGGLNSLWLD